MAGALNIFEDLPYTLRTLRRNPAFASAAVATLALGIGGNAAMFTVIRAVLLKPPPQSGRIEIIGVASDVHEIALAADPGPEMYLPAILRPPQALDVGVRTNGDPLRLAATIRGAVRTIDRDQAASDVKTEEQVVDTSLGQRHLTLRLLEISAGVALLLSLLGI